MVSDKVRDIRNAFIDGVVSGIDPIGIILKSRFSLGYFADKYSVFENKNFTEEAKCQCGNVHKTYYPVKRSLEEQVAKGVGDAVGLGYNLLGGLTPQFIFFGCSIIMTDIYKRSHG